MRFEIWFLDNYTNRYQGPFVTTAASLDEAIERMHEKYGHLEFQITNLKIDGRWQDVSKIEY